MWGLLIALVAGIALTYWYAYSTRPHEPVQPISFSHHTHTAPDKAGMNCRACHTTATHSAAASLPPASTCLDCHRHILASDPRLLPLHAAVNPDHPAYTGEPLKWVRKAPLPASVHFLHGQHVSGGISCEECHATPDAQPPHTMRSCLDCHRRLNHSVSCDRCHH